MFCNSKLSLFKLFNFAETFNKLLGKSFFGVHIDQNIDFLKFTWHKRAALTQPPSVITICRTLTASLSLHVLVPLSSPPVDLASSREWREREEEKRTTPCKRVRLSQLSMDVQSVKKFHWIQIYVILACVVKNISNKFLKFGKCNCAARTLISLYDY